MKPKTRFLFPSLLTVAFASLANIASAQNGTKANNANALNDPLSWVGSTPPTSGTGMMIIDGTMASNQSSALGGNLSVAGIRDTGGGTLTITNTANAALTIGSSGITFNANGGRINFQNAVALSANQTWDLSYKRINLEGPLTTNGNTLSIQGTFNGTTPSILALYGNNTLGSEVTISHTGNLWIGNSSAHVVTINGTNNTNAAVALFAGTLNIASMGNVGGASSIGAGTLSIRATSTLNYTGGNATSNKGMARDTNSGGTLGDTTFNVTQSGQTLTMSGDFVHSGTTQTGAWIFGGAGNLTLSGVVQEGSATKVTKNGAGTLTLSNVANTYTGATTITDGVLSAAKIANGSSTSSIGNSTNSAANLVFNGGTLKYTGANTTSDRAFTINAGKTATIDTANNLSFAGATGTATNGALTKTGAGTLTLTGTNTYTGVTTVNNGKLSIASGGTINGTSGVTIAGGEFNYNSSTALSQAVTFSGTGGTLSGSGTISQSVNVTAGNTLAIGNSPGTMNFSNTLGLNGTTVMEIDGTVGAGVASGYDFANLTGAGAAGVITYGGALTLDMGAIFTTGSYSWNLFDFAGETGTFATITLTDQYSGSLLDADLNGVWDLTNGDNTWQFTESTGELGLTVVPEPRAALLGGLGMLMLLRRRR